MTPHKSTLSMYSVRHSSGLWEHSDSKMAMDPLFLALLFKGKKKHVGIIRGCGLCYEGYKQDVWEGILYCRFISQGRPRWGSDFKTKI